MTSMTINGTTIELRKISYNAALSDETPAYSADLWIAGEKIGTVRNAGHGGPDEFNPWAAEKRLDELAKTLPVREVGGYKIEWDAELVCHDILNRALTAKDLSRLLKKEVLLVLDGKVVGYSVRKTKLPLPELLAATRKKHAGQVILNDMPLEEAAKIYYDAALAD